LGKEGEGEWMREIEKEKRRDKRGKTLNEC